MTCPDVPDFEIRPGVVERRDLLVELRRFELLTPSMRTRCATGLRHSPRIGSPGPYPGAASRLAGARVGSARPAFGRLLGERLLLVEAGEVDGVMVVQREV